jgi:Spx/MgsR family transcriptional regulator
MLKLFGIKNCDTVKKARKWLESHDHDYTFHDFRSDGLNKKQVETWLEKLGNEVLINRRSTTYRGLSDKDKSCLENQGAIDLLVEHPTLIKRPVLEHNNDYMVGFKADDYEKLLDG